MIHGSVSWGGHLCVPWHLCEIDSGLPGTSALSQRGRCLWVVLLAVLALQTCLPLFGLKSVFLLLI